ncbi:unnamed protein product [Adineta ricciae]|uniref:MARVEL domain-containing protein n=1 Tax=Adineta ricciae TaxID=249248 RepID=A0A815ZJ71_ADIRI|nr:unnamed protein product [Adineta ricciae]CAF1583923.1 unnamed protein product [Adineta ricciae]
MVDISYTCSLLGFANIIELILLAGGFIAVCIASTGYAQLVDSYSNIIKYNITASPTGDWKVFYDIDAFAIKQADQAILMIIFILTAITFIFHVLFNIRYRYSWHRFSTAIAFLCIIYAFALCGVSIVVACWEDKLRKQLTNIYLNNQFINTPNGFVKPQIGSAAAASAFGFAACVMYLVEALIRFRRLADKLQT